MWDYAQKVLCMWYENEVLVIGNSDIGYFNDDCTDCACSDALMKQGIKEYQSDIRNLLPDQRHRTLFQISPNLYLRNWNERKIILLGFNANGVLIVDRLLDRLLSSDLHYIDWNSLRKIFPRVSASGFEHILSILLAFDVLRLSDLPNYKKLAISQRLSAWLSLTHQCNSACSYCFIAQGREKMDTGMALKSVDAVFCSALAYGYSKVKFKYAGGEPTLNFDSLKVAQEHAEFWEQDSGINLESVLLTNGLYLPDEYIDYLIDHHVGVMVSLDGLGSYHNNQRRAKNRNLSANVVLGTIERLIQRGISPFISVTITQQNIDGLPKLVEYLLEKELHFSFNFYRDPGLENSPSQQFDHHLLIGGLFKTFDVIKQQIPRFSLLSSLADRADLRFSHQRACGAGESYIVISPDGKISNCQMEMQFPITTVDHENPLTMSRTNESRLKNLLVDQKDECRECVWRYRCGGGCPRETYRAFGSFNSKSPLCDVYQAIFPEIIELEALRLLKYEKPWEFWLQ